MDYLLNLLMAGIHIIWKPMEEWARDRGYRLVEVGQGQQMGQVSRMFLIRDTRDENNLDISVYEIEGNIWVDNIDYGHFISKMIER